jgi:hypothetical protein
MSFSFSHKNHKDGYYLTLIFLEKEVSVFLVKSAAGKTEVIVSKDVRHNVTIQDGIDSQKVDRLKLILAKLFTIVHTEAARASGKKYVKLEKAFVIFSYPWFFSDEMHISLTGSGISVSEREVLEQIESRFDESLGKKAEPLRPTLLEYSVNNIKLNGYSVARPYGKKTERIDIVATTISIFPEIEQLTEVELNAFFKCGKPSLMSLPKVCAHKRQGVFIVMDSSNTMVVNAPADHSYRVKDINIGVEEIVKAAVDVFGAESEVSALSYLRMAKEDVLANEISTSVIHAVKEKMIDWSFLVKEAVNESVEPAEAPEPIVVYRRGLKSFTDNFIKDQLPLPKKPALQELEELVSNPLNLEI